MVENKMIETELIHRQVVRASPPSPNQLKTKPDNVDDLIEQLPNPLDASGFNKRDQTDEIIDEALKNVAPRWKNWTIRTIFTLLMLTSLIFVVYLGTFAILLLVFAIFGRGYYELLSIGFYVFKAEKATNVKSIGWFYFCVVLYSRIGDTYFSKLDNLNDGSLFSFLIAYHRLALNFLTIFRWE